MSTPHSTLLSREGSYIRPSSKVADVLWAFWTTRLHFGVNARLVSLLLYTIMSAHHIRFSVRGRRLDII